MVKSSPSFSDSSGIREHADCTRHFGQISARNNGGGLVVDANLESGGAPINKLDAPLSLDDCNGRVDILESKEKKLINL